MGQITSNLGLLRRHSIFLIADLVPTDQENPEDQDQDCRHADGGDHGSEGSWVGRGFALNKDLRAGDVTGAVSDEKDGADKGLLSLATDIGSNHGHNQGHCAGELCEQNHADQTSNLVGRGYLAHHDGTDHAENQQTDDEPSSDLLESTRKPASKQNEYGGGNSTRKLQKKCCKSAKPETLGDDVAKLRICMLEKRHQTRAERKGVDLQQ